MPHKYSTYQFLFSLKVRKKYAYCKEELNCERRLINLLNHPDLGVIVQVDDGQAHVVAVVEMKLNGLQQS